MTLIHCILRSISPDVKQRKRKDDHSSPFSADVKNVFCFTSEPLVGFRVAVVRNKTIHLFLLRQLLELRVV